MRRLQATQDLATISLSMREVAVLLDALSQDPLLNRTDLSELDPLHEIVRDGRQLRGELHELIVEMWSLDESTTREIE